MQVMLVDAGDLKAAAKALRQFSDGKELGRQLSRNLRVVAQPLVPKVKAAWLSAPSKGHASSSRARRGQPNLRALLAKATRVEVRRSGRQAGVRVRTDGRKMPSGMRSLPGYAEGVRRRPWRHPVFGNPELWVRQEPFPRFYDAVQPDETQARQAVERAVADIFDKIARAR
jgi:hypothetical protein